MRISDWSSDVCSSDLPGAVRFGKAVQEDQRRGVFRPHVDDVEFDPGRKLSALLFEITDHRMAPLVSFRNQSGGDRGGWQAATDWGPGTEEVTMRVYRLGVVRGRAEHTRNGGGEHMEPRTWKE